MDITGTSSPKFLESSRVRTNRRWEPTYTKDFDELIKNYDYSRIISGSRKLYANSGIVKGAIQMKASYSVGQAFLPQYLGASKDWKLLATDWLSKFYNICDVSGRDFQTMLYLASVTIDRDGDFFVLLTETKTGYPQLQCIPSHQIGQRDDATTVADGKYKYLKISKGVITTSDGRPMAYRVLGKTPDKDQDISAQDMIHAFESEYIEATRGLALFSHAINEFKDMKDSTEKEMLAQLLASSIAFVETNPYGAPDESNPTIVYESSDGKPSCETFEDGTIKFFRSGDGSKLENITNTRPSAEYQAFHDRLERIALVGTGWPQVMLDAANGSGVADRIALRQATKACEDRQALLKPMAQRIVSWAISKAIKLGLLPPDPDFYKWNFSTPPHLSVDFGRDSNSIREMYKLGLINLTDILEEQGKTLEDHLYQRAREEAQSILIRQETDKQYSVQIDPQNMRLNTAALSLTNPLPTA